MLIGSPIWLALNEYDPLRAADNLRVWMEALILPNLGLVTGSHN